MRESLSAHDCTGLDETSGSQTIHVIYHGRVYISEGAGLLKRHRCFPQSGHTAGLVLSAPPSTHHPGGLLAIYFHGIARARKGASASAEALLIYSFIWLAWSPVWCCQLAVLLP